MGRLRGRLRSLLILAGVEYALTPLRLPEIIFQVDLRQWYGSTINVVRQGIWLAIIVGLWFWGAPLSYVIGGRVLAAVIESAIDLGVRAPISSGEREIPVGTRLDDFFAFVSDCL